jgi:hypothetical protein
MQTHAANKGTQCKLEQEPWRIIQISRDMNWLRKRACRDYSALALDWLNPVIRCGHDASLRWQPDMWDGGQPQSTRGPFAACFTLRLTGVCSADFPARAAICNVLLVEQLSWAQDARSTLGYLNNGRSKREPQAYLNSSTFRHHAHAPNLHSSPCQAENCVQQTLFANIKGPTASARLLAV